MSILEKILKKGASKPPGPPRPNAKAYSPGRGNSARPQQPVEKDSEPGETVSIADNETGTWFQVLGINPRGASIEDARRAFRKKIRMCHPDRVLHLSESEKKTMEEMSARLNLAYAQAKKVLN